MYRYILRDMSGYGFKRNYYAGHHNNYNIIMILDQEYAEVFDDSTSAYLLATYLNAAGYQFRVEVLEN